MLKTYLKAIIGVKDQLTTGKFYEAIQVVQYNKENYFVVKGDNDKLLTLDINHFEQKEEPQN